MNLFFKKLTGKLLSTEKMEQHIEQMQEDIRRYRRIEQSDEYAEYISLKQAVADKAFQQKKQQLLTTKYKETKPFETLQRLRTLEKNRQLQLFLQVKDSALLKEYLAFRNSEDYVKLSDRKTVRRSPDLKRLSKFEHSKAYQAYKAMQSSPLPQEYAELKALTASEHFQQENAFWANKCRWNTTKEHQQEIRLAQLADTPDIVFFLKQDLKKITVMEGYELTFGDEFSWKALADSSWRAGLYYKNKALKQHHSYANEQQAYNNGKNSGTINGTLTLLTKREEVTAPAWDEKKGFINKAFHYTSDTLQTADAFQQKEGLFMVKLRCTGNIYHTCSLTNSNRQPLLSLFHFNGKRLRVGSISNNSVKTENISGISPEDYYIYSLVWKGNTLIWYVNNIEVLRTDNLPKEELFFMLSSFIPDRQKAQEGKLEVEWVRAYQY